MVIRLTERQKNELMAELDKLHEEYKNILILKENAYSNGDLSENAEYEFAVKQEKIISNDIAKLEEKLSNSVVIEIAENDNIIQIGSIVRLRIKDSSIKELAREEGAEFEIVADLGSISSDDKHRNELSIQQPVGKLIYKRPWSGTPETLYYMDRDNKQRVLDILEVRQ